MARLRYRFELKSDAKGIQLQKLAIVADEFQRFLRMIAEDVGYESLKSGWQAVDFYNGSVGFDVEYTGQTDEDQVRIYTRAVRRVTAYDPRGPNAQALTGVRKDTVLQYAKVGGHIDPIETINLGFFTDGDSEPDEWQSLSKSTAIAMTETLDKIVEYRGMVQGIVHSLYKENHPPYFDVRELSKQDLVKCFYSPEKYRQVVELLRNKDSVVLVSGTIKARRIDRKIEEVRVERLRAVDPLSPEELRRLQGAAPNLTGDLSTEEFVDQIRRTHENGDE
jgi:hypothetical protein